MKVFIKNILILDPFVGRSYRSDVLINQYKIEKIQENISCPKDLDLIIDGTGRMMCPGFVDLHTHLREPGFEYKEDIESGSKAAAHGGFTTITAFPNTNPVLDSVKQIEAIQKKINDKAVVQVLPVASITMGQKGKELVDFKSLHDLGVKAFTDDGKGVQDLEIMVQAMEKIKELNSLVLLHTENEFLVEGGVIHQGRKAQELGVKGIPAEAEEAMLLRDIALAKKTGVRTHFCHISTAFGASMISEAKRQGISITAETGPHYLCLTEDIIKSDQDSNKKMNPPLRSEKDRLGLIKCYKNKDIDIIATDHAPHSKEEKARGISLAPFGIIGLETALPMLYTYLVKTRQVDFYRIIESLTVLPSKIMGLDFYPIQEGNSLNFIIFNMKEKSQLNDDFFYSKSRNFPLFGETLDGKIEHVFYRTKHFQYK